MTISTQTEWRPHDWMDGLRGRRRCAFALGWLLVGLLGSCRAQPCARDCPSGFECVAAAGACLLPCVDDLACPDGQICVDQYCARGNRRQLGDGGGPGGDGDSPEGDALGGDPTTGGDGGCPTFLISSLVINDASDMVPFQDLSCFRLAGSLTIQSATLTDVNGLHGLTVVGQGILVTSNTQLTSLAGLASLQAVHGDLRIRENPSLNNLGLDALELVFGDLAITDNPNLPTSQAEALASQVFLTGQATISGNGSD